MRSLIIIGIIGILILSSIGMAYPHNNNVEKINETYTLVIIAPSTFQSDLEPLITHKNEFNIPTTLKVVEEIYEEFEGTNEAEQIKYFIKYAIETWDTQYILLVGGRKPSIATEEWLIPAIYAHIEDNFATPEKRYISDLYYADIYDTEGNFSTWDTNDNGVYSEWYANEPADDTMDLYPDVAIGRLACRNKIEVKVMVQKIIQYEKEKAAESWFNRMVVVAGDTYTDNDYFEGEEATQRALENMTGFEPVKLWTSDGSFTGWHDVVREIIKGCGFLFFAGHGSPASWATHPPYNDSIWIKGLGIHQMPLLFNLKKLPICVVGGCHNSMFNVSFFHRSWFGNRYVPECWSWWLTRKLGGGAIATFGCTGLGYGKEDKQNPELGGASEYLEMLFFKEYGQYHTEFLGDVWKNVVTTYLDEFPIDWNQHAFNDTALDAKSVQEWVLLGDPSLKIGGYNI